MAIPLRLLLIADSEDDAALVVRALTFSGYDVMAERVETGAALVEALEKQRWDLAIADYSMPRFSGTAALELLRERDPDMPFIFVSGTIGDDAAVAAIKTGAQDYIMKGNLKRLIPAVDRELRETSIRRQRKLAEQRLAHSPITTPSPICRIGAALRSPAAIRARRPPQRPPAHAAGPGSRSVQGHQRHLGQPGRRSSAPAGGIAAARHAARGRSGRPVAKNSLTGARWRFDWAVRAFRAHLISLHFLPASDLTATQAAARA